MIEEVQNKTAAILSMYKVEENFCRNPSMTEKDLWCSVSKETKENCSIPMCSDGKLHTGPVKIVIFA